MKKFFLFLMMLSSIAAYSQLDSKFDWSSQIGADTAGVADGMAYVKVGDNFEWRRLNYITYVSNEATIKASGGGVTYNMSNGVGTVSIPDGVDLIGVSVKVTDGDLNPNGHFSLTLDNLGVVPYNNSYADIYAPSLQVIQSSAIAFGPPSESMPFIYDEGSAPQTQITGIGGGDITTRILNASQFSQFIVNCKF